MKTLKQFFDGFVSTITAVGNNSRDKGKSFAHYRSARIPNSVLEQIYAENPLAWKLVDLYPDDATRKGIETDEESVFPELERLNALQEIRKALKIARLFGGAAILMDIADGQELTAPAKQGPVRSLTVIEPDYIRPENWSPYKRTEYYRLQTEDRFDLIHYSRLLVFDGVDVSSTIRKENDGWGESVLRRCYQPLIAVDVAHGLVPTILQDFIQGVLKLNGLNEEMANDCDASTGTIKARLDAMLYGRSVINDLVLDKEDEYQRQTTNVAGINDLIRNPERWLVAASGIPHTKLLGESPGASLSQAGTSQDKDWAKAVSAYQEDEVRPALNQLLKQIAGEPVEFEFCALDEPTELEWAEIHYKQAQADSIYFGLGVVSSDDLIYSRFSKGKYSTKTIVDSEANERTKISDPIED